MSSDQNRQNGFTALRLGAGLFVLFTHSYVLLGRGEAEPLARLTQYASFSGLGVDTFFAISGYLICQSLLRQSSPRAYLARRCLRILPALAVMIALTVFVFGPLITTSPDYWASGQTYRYLLGAFLFLWQGFLPGVFVDNPVTVVNGSLWTLPLEACCYLLLLAVSWCGALNWRGLLLLTSGSLALHLADSFLAHQTILGMDLLHLNRLGTIFCGGGLLATLGERVVYSRVAAAVAAFLILAALWWGQSDWHRFAAVYLVLLPYVVVTAALSLRWLDWLNRWDISYGVYLYAFLVQQCLVQALGSSLSVLHLTVLSAAGTVLCATLSWLIVERPALALKARDRQPRPLGNTAAGAPTARDLPPATWPAGSEESV